MPSTGTFLFHPELAELVDEAFEQAGVDPAKLTSRHIRSAVRSANLMMGTWFNKGWKQWTFKFVAQSLTQGLEKFELPNAGWDIFHATVQDDDGSEIEMGGISRTDYNALHKKDLEGRPDRYFVDRSTYLGINPKSTVYLWQRPDKAYTMNIWYIRRTEDVGRMHNTLDLPWHWTEAFSSGLAYRIAKKFPPPEPGLQPGVPTRVDKLKSDAEEYYRQAIQSERETSDLVFTVGGGGRRRR